MPQNNKIHISRNILTSYHDHVTVIVTSQFKLPSLLSKCLNLSFNNSAFSALMLLVGQQEGHLACKN